MDPDGIIKVIGAIVAGIILVLQAWNQRTTNEIKTQVTAINGSSIAEITDGNETRRIRLVAIEDRTAAEHEHLANVSETGEQV